ncbi:MAG: hypothetical protein WKG07_43000 [Hymenobacter sp.]
MRPGRTTQFVFRNGEVMERTGRQLKPLTQNVRLPNGTKINVRSGIVEFPGVSLPACTKATTSTRRVALYSLPRPAPPPRAATTP